MALFGTLPVVRSQLPDHPSFATALAYVATCLDPASAVGLRLAAVTLGETNRHELGGGVFALEQAYYSKPRIDGRWESHTAYIDIQVIVAGEEAMEVTDTSRLAVDEDLRPARDLIFYRSFIGASVLRVRTGDAAVFFPADAHLPSLAISAPVLVRKTVVKVPVFA